MEANRVRDEDRDSETDRERQKLMQQTNMGSDTQTKKERPTDKYRGR